MIWVQTVCQGYQQESLVNKELRNAKTNFLRCIGHLHNYVSFTKDRIKLDSLLIQAVLFPPKFMIDFNFDIVKFPFLDGDVPRRPSTTAVLRVRFGPLN